MAIVVVVIVREGCQRVILEYATFIRLEAKILRSLTKKESTRLASRAALDQQHLDGARRDLVVDSQSGLQRVNESRLCC